jgi:hypothetical protein
MLKKTTFKNSYGIQDNENTLGEKKAGGPILPDSKLTTNLQ